MKKKWQKKSTCKKLRVSKRAGAGAGGAPPTGVEEAMAERELPGKFE